MGSSIGRAVTCSLALSLAACRGPGVSHVPEQVPDVVPVQLSLTVLPARGMGEMVRVDGRGVCASMADEQERTWEVRLAGSDSATARDVLFHLGEVEPAVGGRTAAVWLVTPTRRLDGRVYVSRSRRAADTHLVLAGIMADGSQLTGTVVCSGAPPRAP